MIDGKPTLRDRISWLSAWPRRDWRFWAALAAFGAVICVGAAMKSQAGTNDGLTAENRALKAQIHTQSAQQECRSRAAVFADTQGAKSDIILNNGLAAFADGRPLAPYTAALTVAGKNYRLALQLRDSATKLCTDDPTYQIDPDLLQPIPATPEDEPG